MTRPNAAISSAGKCPLSHGATSWSARVSSRSSGESRMMNAAPYTEPATLPRPPTMIIARKRMDSSSVNLSHETVEL